MASLPSFTVPNYFINLQAGLEMLIGVEVIVTGDEMRPNEPSIIIMNHRTRLDWLYFFCVLARQPSGIMTEKIILKAPLKHIPGPGQLSQKGNILFYFIGAMDCKF